MTHRGIFLARLGAMLQRVPAAHDPTGSRLASSACRSGRHRDQAGAAAPTCRACRRIINTAAAASRHAAPAANSAGL